MYWNKAKRSRQVPVAFEVRTADMLRTGYKMRRTRDRKMPIAAQVQRQINNIHACDAQMFYDVVY